MPTSAQRLRDLLRDVHIKGDFDRAYAYVREKH